MRLARPHIPLEVRCRVALRQMDNPLSESAIGPPWGTLLKFLLLQLAGRLGCEVSDLELHHRPALVNRQRKRNGDYDPPANHPDFLVYLSDHAHDIETRVRGLHGQHSDLAIVRKRKRKEKKAKRRKTVWPTRPLRSASRWPKRAMR
jgi:hypothetical protein